MNDAERREFIINETNAIYEEFEAYLNQLIMLKPFFKNLADVANGANPSYRLNEIIKTEK